MRYHLTLCIALTAISVCVAVPALSAVGCSATGSVETVEAHELWEFHVDVTWDFNDAAIPERFNISLEHLDDCIHYQPEAPNQQHYVVPGTASTAAAPGCLDIYSNPSSEVVYVGERVYEDPDCWMPSRFLTYRNDGPTPDCDPLPAGQVRLSFVSRGAPMGPTQYYDIIQIVASDGTCVVCDYFGPLPDCNMWSPVEQSTWSTVKALYR